MSIWWCRGCGREDTRGTSACPSCGSAMKLANVDWLAPGDEGEETIFELDPEPLERAAIVDALVHEGIRHRWDASDGELVVADAQADSVDAILDEILGVETRADDSTSIIDLDQNELDEGEYSDAEGAGYQVLSRLYVAVDRLQNDRGDDEVIEFASVTGVALMTPPPFGIDEETWADIQAAARNAATALEADRKAQVDGELKALRNQLHELV